MAQRLDKGLVERGLVASRSRAQDLIKQGRVLLNDAPLTKATAKLSEEQWQALVIEDHPWVSRAGLKLAGAFERWPELAAQLAGHKAMDLGASTGGFTQVLLAHGAEQVASIDVGSGQLHDSLRSDARVVSLEGLNCRTLEAEDLPPELLSALAMIVCDLSFISLKLALPAALELAPPGCHLLALIKPQFEAGRQRLGKGGVVRDASVVEAVEADLVAWFQSQGWQVRATASSPILGPDGNEERLCWACKSEPA